MSIVGALILAILGQSGSGNPGPEASAKGQDAVVPTAAVANPVKNPPIFKVLVWYHRDEPLKTFRYQEYDLRKNECTPAVDAWIQNVRKQFPAYEVIVREVDADLQPGQTEKLKVGSVIKTELTVAAAMSGIVIGAPAKIGPGPSGVLSFGRRAESTTAAQASDRSFLNRPRATFPVPIPYPRPHP